MTRGVLGEIAGPGAWRVLLAVAGEEAIEASVRARPDALILSDGAAPSIGTLRRMAPELAICLRLPLLGAGEVDAVLDRAMAAWPDAMLLPCPGGRRDAEHLAAKLAVREALGGREDGATRMIVLVEDAAGILALPSLLAEISARLAGIALDEARLQAALACGAGAAALAQARAAVILAASALRVPAVWVDPPGSGLDLEAARGEGFSAAIIAEPERVREARIAMNPTAGPSSGRRGAPSPLAGEGVSAKR